MISNICQELKREGYNCPLIEGELEKKQGFIGEEESDIWAGLVEEEKGKETDPEKTKPEEANSGG